MLLGMEGLTYKERMDGLSLFTGAWANKLKRKIRLEKENRMLVIIKRNLNVQQHFSSKQVVRVGMGSIRDSRINFEMSEWKMNAGRNEIEKFQNEFYFLIMHPNCRLHIWDLGVQAHSSLKAGSEVDRVVKKAFSMLSFIGRDIEYRSWNVVLQLYKSL
eukprot:g42943.t1